MEYEYIGAIKIKDGLFLGDQFAAQDLEFVVTNKVTKIINCAGKQIPNHWESIGIAYLTFNWLDNDTQVIFDQKDEVLNQSYKFIEDALTQGESVIVHSVRGHNRSVCVLCLYFMKKFRWTLYKTLQYLHSRRPDLEIRANFFNQLLALEGKLQKLGIGAKTYNWDEIFEEGEDAGEEKVLRNTYLNAQAQGVADFKDTDNRPKQNKIKWLDSDGKTVKLVTMTIPPYDQIDFVKRGKPGFKNGVRNSSARQILKMSNNSEQKKEVSKSEIKETIPKNENVLNNNQEQLMMVKQGSLKEIKQTEQRRMAKKEGTTQKKEEEQLSLNQIANNQLQQKLNRPKPQIQDETDENQQQPNFSRTLDQKFINDKTKGQQQQKVFSSTYQPAKVNNFVQSNDQWYKPPTSNKTRKQELPVPGFIQQPKDNKDRPSTAPNNTSKQVPSVVPTSQFRLNKHQNQNQNVGGKDDCNQILQTTFFKELIITPYKRQSSLGSRVENNTLPSNQFRPQGNRQRGFSPQNVYSSNPYAQKSFKPWRK